MTHAACRTFDFDHAILHMLRGTHPCTWHPRSTCAGMHMRTPQHMTCVGMLLMEYCIREVAGLVWMHDRSAHT